MNVIIMYEEGLLEYIDIVIKIQVLFVLIDRKIMYVTFGRRGQGLGVVKIYGCGLMLITKRGVRGREFMLEFRQGLSYSFFLLCFLLSDINICMIIYDIKLCNKMMVLI